MLQDVDALPVEVVHGILGMDVNFADTLLLLSRAFDQMGPEDKARIKALENEISAAQKELSKLKSLSEGLQLKAADLQKKMDEAGGPKLKAGRAAVERLQKVLPLFKGLAF